MILVLGGGITGLAAGRVLAGEGRDFRILEAEAEPGGHCRSIRDGGYTFDRSGHFLHLADPETGAFLRSLPGVRWREKARDARVWLRGRETPYPFQANLFGHDRAFVRRCLAEFARERVREALGEARPSGTFAEWLEARFGRAMCRAFFFPYNRKLWRTPLDDLTPDWTGWAVPVPRFEELLAGATGTAREGMGYNATFLYPASGGIGALPRALAAPVRSRIRTGSEVVSVDLGNRSVRTADGAEHPFREAISTIPLPALARIARGLPAPARRAAEALRWVKILAVNVGVRRPARTFGSWVYVPERNYPFFRVGFLSNVWKGAAPPGCASVFVEKAFLPGTRVRIGEEVRSALRGLRELGVLGRGSRVETVRPVLLDPGYVLFDRARREAVRWIARELRARGVRPAGRYGAWDYYGMERSVADGIRAARECLGRKGKGRAG